VGAEKIPADKREPLIEATHLADVKVSRTTCAAIEALSEFGLREFDRWWTMIKHQARHAPEALSLKS